LLLCCPWPWRTKQWPLGGRESKRVLSACGLGPRASIGGTRWRSKYWSRHAQLRHRLGWAKCARCCSWTDGNLIPKDRRWWPPRCCRGCDVWCRWEQSRESPWPLFKLRTTSCACRAEQRRLILVCFSERRHCPCKDSTRGKLRLPSPLARGVHAILSCSSGLHA